MVVASDAAPNVPLPSLSHSPLLCLFAATHGNQPKDTQQALSRKESAVNMEKFKKFAARRKWKVSLGFGRATRLSAAFILSWSSGLAGSRPTEPSQQHITFPNHYTLAA